LDAEEKLKDEKRKTDIENQAKALNDEVNAEIEKNTKKQTLADAQTLEELDIIYEKLAKEQTAKQEHQIAELVDKQNHIQALFEAEFGAGEALKALREQHNNALNGLNKIHNDQNLALVEEKAKAEKEIKDAEADADQ